MHDYILLSAFSISAQNTSSNILYPAEQEVAVAAREQMAAEMRVQTDAVRAQRHDFVNHVQVMVALLNDGRKEELARYTAGIRREL
ncbi:MAG: Spo0B domain-containing protein [Bacillota bacterium]